MSDTPMVTRVLDYLAERVTDLGFRRVGRGTFVSEDMASEVRGWLGLNTSTRRIPGAVSVMPVVGVRHEGVEKLLTDLLFDPGEVPAGRDLGATLTRPIGDLADRKRWAFDESPADETNRADLVDAVDTFGRRFTHDLLGDQAILNEINRGAGFAHQNRLTIPVLLLHTGGRDVAQAHVSATLDEIADKDDLAAQQFRSFAARFEEHVAEMSDGG